MPESAKTKFYPYKVTRIDKSKPLEKIIDRVSKVSSLEKRVRKVDGRPIRAEKVSWDKGLNCWLMDFVLFRDGHGPGKASFSTPMQGHTYKLGEYPCEDTAALFHPKSSHLIVQYNHQGVRVGALVDYLSNYDADEANGYDLSVLYDHAAMDRFKSRQGSKSLEVTIAPMEMTASDWDADTPIGSGLRAGQKADAPYVSLKFSMRNRRGVLGQVVEGQMKKLAQMIGRGDTQGIERVKAGVVKSIDAKTEVIDLMTERLNFARSLSISAERRIPRSERWSCLRAAFKTWKDRLK